MIDYETAFKRPFTDMKKYLIGILVSILPIVNFFSLGYIIEAANMSIHRKHELPEWKQPAQLFLDGFSSVIITIAYFLPAFIIFAISVSFSGLRVQFFNAMRNNDVAQLQSIFSQLGPLLFAFVLLMLLAIYLYPVAVLRYAESRKFLHAFDMTKVIGYAFSSIYPGPWLIATLISFIMYYILSFLPYIGNAIATFTSGIITYTILAQAYGQIRSRL